MLVNLAQRFDRFDSVEKFLICSVEKFLISDVFLERLFLYAFSFLSKSVYKYPPSWSFKLAESNQFKLKPTKFK